VRDLNRVTFEYEIRPKRCRHDWPVFQLGRHDGSGGDGFLGVAEKKDFTSGSDGVLQGVRYHLGPL